MKTSVVALSLFAAVGLAAPEASYGKYNGYGKYNSKSVKWDGEKVSHASDQSARIMLTLPRSTINSPASTK